MRKKHFERFMLVFATVEPIATIPQIVEVWIRDNTSGVSLLTWIVYTMTSCVWLIYGIYRKDLPLIVSGVLWVASQGLVVLGLLLS